MHQFMYTFLYLSSLCVIFANIDDAEVPRIL